MSVRRAVRGQAMAEMLVGLCVASVVALAACTWLSSELRWASAVTRRAATADAFRLVQQLLPQELRFTRPGRDMAAVGADSIALRLLRGSGIVCDSASTSFLVRLRAARGPDPSKDSLLWLAGGEELPIAVDDSAPEPDGCAPGVGEAVYRLRGSAAPPVGALVLLFEHGAYHLQGSALRYRRGGGGRQPLTEAVFDDGRSAFELADGGSALLLRLRSLGTPRVERPLVWSARIPFANRELP